CDAIARMAERVPMFINVRTVVEWQVDQRSFKLVTTDAGAELITPDGQCLSLSLAEWAALPSALQEVFPSSKPQKTNRASQAPNHGQPWPPDLDNDLLRRWNSGLTIGELAKQMGRSRGSISARLVIVGAVDNRDEAELKSRQRQLSSEGSPAAIRVQPPV
ncbi:MAG: hypothetical protein ABL996_26525, partial [Micropepsaceae bacterium]